MGKAKKGREKSDDRDDEEDEDEELAGLAARDDAMARLAGALASLKVAEENVISALTFFVNPDDDSDGSEREEAIGEALEATGAASRGLEAAVEALKDADTEAGEPFDDEDD